MSTAESHLALLESVVHSAESLCESDLCCIGDKKVCGLRFIPKQDTICIRICIILLQPVIQEL